MTYDYRSASEIEHDIEYDRSRLNENLGAFQESFSLDGALGQIGAQLRTHGGEIRQSITRTVKENPASVALTGAGIAWTILGGKSRDADHFERQSGRPYRTDAYPVDRSHGASGPDPRLKGGGAGVPDWAQSDEDDHSDRARAMRDKVAAATSGSTRSAASAEAEGSRSMRDRAGEMSDRMRARLSEGTEHFSDEARSRVIAAREAADDARYNATAARSARAEQAGDLYERQPLVVGALALAVGAAIGGALPRTRTEDGGCFAIRA